jgi:hypothetical protein
MFEGNSSTMLRSLDRLAGLDGETMLWPGKCRAPKSLPEGASAKLRYNLLGYRSQIWQTVQFPGIRRNEEQQRLPPPFILPSHIPKWNFLSEMVVTKSSLEEFKVAVADLHY